MPRALHTKSSGLSGGVSFPDDLIQNTYSSQAASDVMTAESYDFIARIAAQELFSQTEIVISKLLADAVEPSRIE